MNEMYENLLFKSISDLNSVLNVDYGAFGDTPFFSPFCKVARWLLSLNELAFYAAYAVIWLFLLVSMIIAYRNIPGWKKKDEGEGICWIYRAQCTSLRIQIVATVAAPALWFLLRLAVGDASYLLTPLIYLLFWGGQYVIVRGIIKCSKTRKERYQKYLRECEEKEEEKQRIIDNRLKGLNIEDRKYSYDVYKLTNKQYEDRKDYLENNSIDRAMWPFISEKDQINGIGLLKLSDEELEIKKKNREDAINEIFAKAKGKGYQGDNFNTALFVARDMCEYSKFDGYALNYLSDNDIKRVKELGYDNRSPFVSRFILTVESDEYNQYPFIKNSLLRYTQYYLVTDSFEEAKLLAAMRGYKGDNVAIIGFLCSSITNSVLFKGQGSILSQWGYEFDDVQAGIISYIINGKWGEPLSFLKVHSDEDEQGSYDSPAQGQGAHTTYWHEPPAEDNESSFWKNYDEMRKKQEDDYNKFMDDMAYYAALDKAHEKGIDTSLISPYSAN